MSSNVGKRLRRERKIRNLTQGDVASGLGVSVTTISDIERDKLKISRRLAGLLQEKFSIDPDWLLTGKIPSDEISSSDSLTHTEILLQETKKITEGRLITLSPTESEVFGLYMSLEPEVRQQVLTEFLLNIVNRSKGQTDFRDEIYPELSEMQYFDSRGNEINLTEHDKINVDSAMNTASDQIKLNESVPYHDETMKA